MGCPHTFGHVTHHKISYFRQQPRVKILWRNRSYKLGSMTKRETLLERQTVWGGLCWSVRSPHSFSAFLSCAAYKKKKREVGACRVLCYFMEILRVTASSGKSSSPLFSLPSFTFLPSPSISLQSFHVSCLQLFSLSRATTSLCFQFPLWFTTTSFIIDDFTYFTSASWLD